MHITTREGWFCAKGYKECDRSRAHGLQLSYRTYAESSEFGSPLRRRCAEPWPDRFPRNVNVQEFVVSPTTT
jgi:hypothetical protein